MSGVRTIVWEKRDTCPAPAHDSRRAWERFKCQCPAALAALEDFRLRRRDQRRGYYWRHRERLLEQNKERAKQRRAQALVDGVTDRPRYSQTEKLADSVMVNRIIRLGPQNGMRRADRWMAAIILLRLGWSAPRTGRQVDLTERTIQRVRAWAREQGLLEVPKKPVDTEVIQPEREIVGWRKLPGGVMKPVMADEITQQSKLHSFGVRRQRDTMLLQ